MLNSKIEELRAIQSQTGAIFTENHTVPVSFDNDAQALQAAYSGVALCDRSAWGLIAVGDRDRLQFLHNQSTNSINTLQPGQGCQTVFVTSTARTIDLVTAYATTDEVLLLVSPHQNKFLMEWLDRYLFPMDRVKLTDLSAQYAIFSLIGQASDGLLSKLALTSLREQPEHCHQMVDLAGAQVRLALGSGLALPGYTLIVPLEQAAAVWQKLTAMGAIPTGERVWSQLRILQGRPLPGQELTEDYNPLEAGLWQAVSFQKGCYIGQETIARLNTYQGVKQRLWGVRLNGEVELGAEVTVDGKKVGKLTSYTSTKEGGFGLAYIRTKAGGAGLQVQLGTISGELVAVPFLSHEYYQP